MRRFEIHRGMVGGSLWRLFAYGGSPQPIDAAHACGRPLLLLYGFLGVPPTMAGLARRLVREGRCVLAFDLGGSFGRLNTSRIDVLAEAVASEIEALVAQGRIECLDVIGYSEGGLIARHYVQQLGGVERVRHLVTLATPHRGSSLAYLGYLLTRMPSLRQMAPNSAFLRALPDDLFPAETRLTSIYCRGDFVCPPSSCRLDERFGAHLRNVELETGTHLDFLFRSALIDAVCREIGPCSRPTPLPRPAVRTGCVERGAAAMRHRTRRAASSA
jgi:triacylglycerol lipase